MKLFEVARDIHRNLTWKVGYECGKAGRDYRCPLAVRYPRNIFCFVSLRLRGAKYIAAQGLALIERLRAFWQAIRSLRGSTRATPCFPSCSDHAGSSRCPRQEDRQSLGHIRASDTRRSPGRACVS